MAKKHNLPSVPELLQDLTTLDEVSARIPTSAEHDQGLVPPWCELMLEFHREPGPGLPAIVGVSHFLRRHDGELIIAVLDQVLHPQYNVRGVEAIWSALDAVVDRVQARVNKGKDPRPADIGEARGLATALAMYTSPRNPDVDEVRAEAMARWDARNGVV